MDANSGISVDGMDRRGRCFNGHTGTVFLMSVCLAWTEPLPACHIDQIVAPAIFDPIVAACRCICVVYIIQKHLLCVM
jgi:hypothetical protein